MNPVKLVIELTNLCNLDCEYCFKELGRSHIDIDLLKGVLDQARACGVSKITFTGGEISLYPHLEEALRSSEALGYRYAIVTNGWYLPRILPVMIQTRRALHHIFFSIDSAEERSHDEVRGAGSFRSVMHAAEACREFEIPFSLLAVINQRNFLEMEQLALLAEKIGAQGVTFGHLLPTSDRLERQLALNGTHRRLAEAVARALDLSLKISVSFSAGSSSRAPGACCEPFAGRTVSIDCHGRLSLCCQLAGYRGSAKNTDIVADLRNTTFIEAYARFLDVASERRACRDRALAMNEALAEFPCHFCVETMGKFRTVYTKEQIHGDKA
jgi:MoaA/NifB/PqqE/SkfB family radical SAM enzyme